MNLSLPHQARRVDPMEARYQDATAFERARDEDVTVDVGDAPGRATMIVGDGDPHDVVLVEDDEGEIGYCDCDGFVMHQDDLAGGVCAHLVALAMEATLNEGLIKTVDDVLEVDDARDHPDVEQTDVVDAESVDAEANTTADVIDDVQEASADVPDRDDRAERPAPQLDDPFASAIEGVDERFVMTLGGDPYIRREGWQRLARSEGYRIRRDMVTLQSETDSTLAECEAQVLDGDDIVAEATGTAHIEAEDLAGAVGNLNELAETRAISRAMGWATGAGLSAVEVDASAEYEDGRARP
ncbi:hypothetical protein EI982_09400 [Haloplanus rallus]|uniref:SWIM-type domain-containing protein n=1 Tax=Haloplanus rallus TaxID=1816183 RepID=A0A6B9FE65_9EURY|nr:hypothetical protein [Haloplanus rallus]QGX94990.1 hypothetical protein EI982_09400 [Haloplanus rallus]